MSTYGELIPKTNQKDSWRNVDQLDGEQSTKRFKYTEVFANHYDYQGAVDDHNNKRHDVGGLGVSLEDTWRTSWWEIRVFTFVCMAIAQVNAYLRRSFFGEETKTMLEFRRKLAYECVYNTIDDVGGVGEAPCYSKWVDGKWKQVYQLNYQQNCCSHRRCRKKVRNVCVCDRTKWICTECYALHLTRTSYCS
jgi:hypothetical protein